MVNHSVPTHVSTDMRTPEERRLAAVILFCCCALLYFTLILWSSTCTVDGCGSIHSSVWLRIGVLVIPFALVAYSGWKAGSHPGESASTLVVAFPWLIVATALSGWELGFAPSAPSGSGSGITETVAPPFSLMVPSAFLVFGWGVVLASIGWSRFRHGLRESLRSHLRKVYLLLGLASAVATALAISLTAYAGTGIDISGQPVQSYGNSRTNLDGLNVDPSSRAGATATPLFVEIDRCKDDQLVGCTAVAHNVVLGQSLNLNPGTYTIRNNPPDGYSCDGTTPQIMYLFPFERLHVQFINLNCQAVTPGASQ